jgi:pimeloyl-ACP methyl ester carboxylesterase
MPLALGDGRTLAWSEGGDPAGTPVLFFHGCPDTRRAAWTGHDAAHAAGVRLIAANRPGYGASTPASPSYELVVGDVAELADPLGLDRFAVIGMSVGGTFALACAARLPYRVTTAALVATPGETSRMDPPYPRDGLDAEGRVFYDALATGTPAENLARLRPEFLAWRSMIDPEDTDDIALAERWLGSLPPRDRAFAEGPVAEVAAAAREAILVPDGYLSDAALVFGRWPFRVEDVGCPVTLWYGERDANAPPRNGAWLAEHLPDATLNLLPGLGHLESLMRSWETILRAVAGHPRARQARSPAAP